MKKSIIFDKADILKVISKLKKEFNSHEFLEKYAKLYESKYILMLGTKEKNAFMTLHSQLAKYLSINASDLNIKKKDREINKNIFGTDSSVQNWEQIL